MAWFSRWRTDAKEERKDSWANVITGLLSSRDKRTGGVHVVDLVTDMQARDLWRGDDIAKRVIETLPREALRRGYELKTGDDKEAAEAIMGAAETLCVDQCVVRAAQYERAYGGSAIFPVMEGALGDLSTPLVEESITRITALHVLEPRELVPETWYTDITSPKFGTPETYRLQPLFNGYAVSGAFNYQLIHETRLIIFGGVKVTRMPQAGTLLGWGDNVLTAMYRVLNDYGQSWGTVAALLQDFAQAVLQIDGLDNLKSSRRGAAARARLEQIDQLRSAFRAIVLDKRDSFTREQTPLTNLSDIMDRFATRLAAAADMPVTLLMGMSPAGLNATGESDRAFFYDRVSALQHTLTPIIERLLRLIMLSIDGPTQGQEPDVWSIKWHALWAPSDKEIADTQYTNAQADALGCQWGWLTEKEVRSRWSGDGYGAIQLDDKAWEESQEVDVSDLTDEDLAAMGRAPAPGAGTGDDTDADPEGDQTGQENDPPARATSTKSAVPKLAVVGKKVPVRQHQRTIRGG